MTLTQFIAKSNISASLIRATVRQFGGWESFQEVAEDVSRHGIDGGFHGFIYYRDTVPFAKKNKSEIIALCEEMADSMGEDGLISFLSGFGCLKDSSQDEIAQGLYNPRSDTNTTVYNALAWLAGEEVCRSYTDLCEVTA